MSDYVLAAAAEASTTPLWQTLLSLLAAVVAILAGVYAFTKQASDATNKRLDDLRDYMTTQSTDLSVSVQRDLAHLAAVINVDVAHLGDGVTADLVHLTNSLTGVASSVSDLDGRIERITGRLDRVIDQQGAAARELAAQGSQLRDVLDRRLGELNSAMALLGERVSRLEGRGEGGPFA